MNTLMKKFTLVLIALSFSFSAFAMSLQDAKEQGLVGEQRNGYLGVVLASAEVEKLVKTVNAKRKQHYLKIARKNSIKLDQVASLAGERNLQKTKAGHLIQNAAGEWIKK